MIVCPLFRNHSVNSVNPVHPAVHSIKPCDSNNRTKSKDDQNSDLGSKSEPFFLNLGWVQVGGYTEEYNGGGFVFATVRDAGHMVPYFQPARGLHLFDRFVNGGGMKSGNRVPLKSTVGGEGGVGLV